eukprot:5114427-Prymnesium_polylepis.1
MLAMLRHKTCHRPPAHPGHVMRRGRAVVRTIWLRSVVCAPRARGVCRGRALACQCVVERQSLRL